MFFRYQTVSTFKMSYLSRAPTMNINYTETILLGRILSNDSSLKYSLSCLHQLEVMLLLLLVNS